MINAGVSTVYLANLRSLVAGLSIFEERITTNGTLFLFSPFGSAPFGQWSKTPFDYVFIILPLFSLCPLNVE